MFFYLLPATRDFGVMLGHWPELVMHLITPVLAIFSFLCFEKGDMTAWAIPLGVLPVLLYGWLYLDRVVVARAWPDFYGFNKNEKWKLSFSLMAAGTVVIAVLLWAL